MASALRFAAAMAAGAFVYLAATLVKGIAAALPVPASYWARLNDYPGLALSLYSVGVDLSVLGVAALLSFGLFRLLGGASPALALACLAPVLVCLAFDLPAYRSLLFPPALGMRQVLYAVSACVSLCAVPAGIWWGSRLAPRSRDTAQAA